MDQPQTYVTVMVAVDVSHRAFGGDFQKYEGPIKAALEAVPGVHDVDFNPFGCCRGDCLAADIVRRQQVQHKHIYSEGSADCCVVCGVPRTPKK